MKEQIRGGDLAGRLGGDEFALFLCGIGREAAERKGALLLKAAERLRGFSVDAEHPLGTSLGVALYDPRTGESLEALFRRADEAMYEAKRSGKHSLALARDYDRRGGRGCWCWASVVQSCRRRSPTRSAGGLRRIARASPAPQFDPKTAA